MSGNTHLTFLARYRWLLNISLTVAGFINLGFYYFCGDSCLYLAGTVFGVDLKIWGFFFLSVFLVLSILKQDILIPLAISAALGAEIFLVGWQIVNKLYCPFCLILALIIIILFIINMTKKRLMLILIAIPAGFLVLFFFFQSIPLNTSNLDLPKFGNGPINVRMYSGYFCDPCQKLEPDAEKILYELVKEDKIQLVFVDLNLTAPIYSSYYLTLAQQEKSLDRVIHLRQALFAAAKNKITDSQELAKYLEDKGFPKVTALIDQSAETFKYRKEDGVDSTPTLIIDRGNGIETYMGRAKIISTLEGLK